MFEVLLLWKKALRNELFSRMGLAEGRAGNKERVVHPDMTSKLACRLILEARCQELNNLACSLKFARGLELALIMYTLEPKLAGSVCD